MDNISTARMFTTVRALTFLLLFLNKVSPLLTAESRIVGGTPAQVGQFPWMAMLLQNGTFICGGSIIDNLHVLTAAHCVQSAERRNAYSNGSVSVLYLDTSEFTIIVGKHFTDTSTSNLGEQRFAVESGIYHEIYKLDYGLNANDIAVLRLERPLTFTSRVRALPLPSSSSQLPSQCIVAGWGYTNGRLGTLPNQLMWAELAAYNRASCVNLRTVLDSDLNWSEDLPQNSMCLTNNTHDGVEDCNGDSGGPSFCQSLSSGQYEQYGLVSWGTPGCPAKRSVPSVHTYVPSFVTWIQDTIKHLSSPCASNPCPTRHRCREMGSSYQCECCACPEGMRGAFCDQCGQTLTASTGNLQTPGFPSYYKSNLDCTWTIVVPFGQKVELTFHQMEIGDFLPLYGTTVSCYDYVNVRENSILGERLTLCGNYVRPFSKTYKTTLYVTFHSDLSEQDVGFRASYKIIGSNYTTTTAPRRTTAISTRTTAGLGGHGVSGSAAVFANSILAMAVALLTATRDCIN